jgi:DNA-binding beta-propeller fold protein YncE
MTAAALLAPALLGPGCSHREPSGGPIEVKVCFGEVGLSPGQFSYPRCLDHDKTSLWVIDKQARVQRLDPKTGQCQGGWQMPEWSSGKPTGVTVWEPEGSDGPLLFIPDTHYNRVMVFDGGSRKNPNQGQGNLLTRFGSYGKGPGQFIFTTDIAILPTPDGKSIARLYVSEYEEDDRISVYEPDAPLNKESLLAMVVPPTVPPTTDPKTSGPTPPAARSVPLIPDCPFKFKFSIGHFGSGTSPDEIQFNRPQSMAIDLKRQELIVTDACNHRIGRFTLDGKLLAWISGPDQIGPEPGHFSYPYGLCLLDDGSALVSEFGGNRVQHIALPSGTSLGIFGQAGHNSGQLASPWGITVMGKTAYVLDSGNNRVIGFNAPGNEVRTATHAPTSEIPQPTSGGHG